ncbi:MAG: sigma-70 family RNA polymerase sigma factor [Tepidisphaeraceae bacterium]|jgi:RNA polymerase sigma-70 factor (ECF subfamily)
MSSFSGAQFDAEPSSGRGAGAGPSSRAKAEAELHRIGILINKARGGDRWAYGQIVLIFQDRLYNAMLRLVGEPEEARELTQETFARGLEKIDTFRGEAGPYTWLFRIGVNLAISQLRRTQRRRVFSLDGSQALGGGDGEVENQAAGLIDRMAGRDLQPSQIAEKREENQMVLNALGKLDPEYRAVLVMRDIEGFDYQQMADALAMPLGTLKSRLFRARLALRDELAPYMSGER